MLTGKLFTKSLREITFWNFLGMIILYGVFNLFAVYSLNYVLEEILKSKLGHELEHFAHSVDVYHDTLTIISRKEFEEQDLIKVTEHPFFLQIYSEDREVYFQSENIQKFGIIPLFFITNGNDLSFNTHDVNDKTLFFAHKRVLTNSGRVFYIQLSTFKSSYDYITKNILLFNILTLPVVILLMSLLSFILAKKSLLPIKKIITTAKEISATNISKRIHYDAESFDELGTLRDTLNNLFDRLERQIDKISDFTDNASHQLMTPLTAMKTELEFILKQPRSPGEYEETLRILNYESERMIKIVNTLLILARDCENCIDNNSVFSFESIITKHLNHIYRDGRLSYDIHDEIYLRGKSEYFLMAFQNIIGNAMKYSQGTVWIRAVLKNQSVFISVADTGPGIPENEKTQIFDRFFRGEDSSVDGFGLGLSLTYSIITAMGGSISVEDNHPRGCVFIIELPAVILGG